MAELSMMHVSVHMLPIIGQRSTKRGQVDENKTLVDSQTRAKFKTLSAKTKHGESACKPAAMTCSVLLSLDIVLFM